MIDQSQNGPNRSTLRGWALVLSVLYGLQAFIVFPWFLGAIYRYEQSFWVWEQYARNLKRFGRADALLAVYLYLIFYSCFFAIPYVLLSAIWKEEYRQRRKAILIASSWVFLTSLVFGVSLLEAIRSAPGIVLFGWVLATGLAILLWKILDT